MDSAFTMYSPARLALRPIASHFTGCVYVCVCVYIYKYYISIVIYIVVVNASYCITLYRVIASY